jgi:uncharacterized protein with NRDE domain
LSRASLQWRPRSANKPTVERAAFFLTISQAMCVLILLRDLHPDYPLLVASNREEDPKRSTMPPGLKVLGERRALCPQDRRFGGTWIGINDRGLVVALTNAPGKSDPDALSRGLVSLEALAQETPSDAMGAVAELLDISPARPFQLLVADDQDCRYASFVHGQYESRIVSDPLVIMTNELTPERCEIQKLATWVQEHGRHETDVEALLDHLVVTLATGKGRDKETGG